MRVDTKIETDREHKQSKSLESTGLRKENEEKKNLIVINHAKTDWWIGKHKIHR
jgi:hypothetical protein